MYVPQNEGAWNTLIISHVKCRWARHALTLYQKMQEVSLCLNGYTIVCLMKACAELRDVERGQEIHAEIARKGLLESDVFAGNALVDMYAKCGLLAKAREVFKNLQVRDVVSWTTLIGGYATHDCGREALNCFEQMQLEGVFPNGVTYVCTLKACGIIGSTNMGRNLHNEIERKGLLREDLAVANALVDMYSKCGALADGRKVFDQLPLRDRVSWSALIMGYTKCREGAEALHCFRQMQLEGVVPDSITYVCSLKACGSAKNADKARELHSAIASTGLLERDLVICNTLIDMYAECGLLVEAHELFHRLPVRDIVSWNSLIDGCVKEELGFEALCMAERMQLEGISPDIVTFVCCLKACGVARAVHKGKALHTMIGSLEMEVVVGNALIDMYAKCGSMLSSQEVFNRLKVRDVVTWTALIACYANHQRTGEALNCFQLMQVEGVSPNSATFVCVLKACSLLRATSTGIEIHSEVERRGLLAKDIVVGNALVDMYTKFGLLAKAHEVFDTLKIKDVASWNTLIAGYAKQEYGKEALDCMTHMKHAGVSPNCITFICCLKACGCMGAVYEGIELHTEIARSGLLIRDGVAGNALVDMYIKCGLLAKAQELFYELPVRDIVSWTTLIAGYTHHECGEQALNCFDQMQFHGISPDAATFVCSLKACKSVGAVNKGREIHAELARRGLLEGDLVIGNSLVEMYATCGVLAKAWEVFDELQVRDSVSWTALIAGYVQQGEIDCAIHTFERMKKEGDEPDVAMFVTVLNACAYAGHVDMGQMYFEAMSKIHCINPSIEHYTCIVDSLCCAGLLDKAVTIINEMPFDPDSVVWYILLDACQKWGNVEGGRQAFEHSIRLNEMDASAYVRMCKMLNDGSLSSQEGGH